MARAPIAFALSVLCCAFGLVVPANVHAASTKPVGFVVPEWKSDTGKVIVKARGRAIHDFYQIDRSFDAGSLSGQTESDDLRALRLGIDGQFTDKVKIRADANLVNGDINWVDVYVGYTGEKYEFYLGQHRLSTTLETASPDLMEPLTEVSLVGLAFAQNVRNFGAIARVKGSSWQVVGGLYHGNLNAGEIFADDAVAYAQVRATHAVRNKDRDVLHVGASLRVRDAQDGPRLRYSVRPSITNYGPRTLDSGFVGKSDNTVSLEALMIRGSLIVSAEHQMMQADLPSGTANLNGSFIAAAWYVTGETRRYSVGTGNLGSVRPRKSVRLGGPGSLALLARLDRLDQSDARFGAQAGRVDAISLGIAWVPVDYVMLRLSVSENRYNSPNAARNGRAQATTARVQFAF